MTSTSTASSLPLPLARLKTRVATGDSTVEGLAASSGSELSTRSGTGDARHRLASTKDSTATPTPLLVRQSHCSYSPGDELVADAAQVAPAVALKLDGFLAPLEVSFVSEAHADNTASAPALDPLPAPTPAHLPASWRQHHHRQRHHLIARPQRLSSSFNIRLLCAPACIQLLLHLLQLLQSLNFFNLSSRSPPLRLERVPRFDGAGV